MHTIVKKKYHKFAVSAYRQETTSLHLPRTLSQKGFSLYYIVLVIKLKHWVH